MAVAASEAAGTAKAKRKGPERSGPFAFRGGRHLGTSRSPPAASPGTLARCDDLLFRQQANYEADHAGEYGNDPRSNYFEALPAISAESQAKFPDRVVGQYEACICFRPSPFAGWVWVLANCWVTHFKAEG